MKIFSLTTVTLFLALAFSTVSAQQAKPRKPKKTEDTVQLVSKPVPNLSKLSEGDYIKLRKAQKLAAQQQAKN